MEVKATIDEAVDIGKEIYGFWGKISAFFGAKPKARPASKAVVLGLRTMRTFQ